MPSIRLPRTSFHLSSLYIFSTFTPIPSFTYATPSSLTHDNIKLLGGFNVSQLLRRCMSPISLQALLPMRLRSGRRAGATAKQVKKQSSTPWYEALERRRAKSRRERTKKMETLVARAPAQLKGMLTFTFAKIQLFLTNFLADLPNDLWLDVFDKMPYNDLKTTAQVDRRFRSLIAMRSFDRILFRNVSVATSLVKVTIHPILFDYCACKGDVQEHACVQQDDHTHVPYEVESHLLPHVGIDTTQLRKDSVTRKNECITNPAVSFLRITGRSYGKPIHEHFSETGIKVHELVTGASSWLVQRGCTYYPAPCPNHGFRGWTLSASCKDPLCNEGARLPRLPCQKPNEHDQCLILDLHMH